MTQTIGAHVIISDDLDFQELGSLNHRHPRKVRDNFVFKVGNTLKIIVDKIKKILKFIKRINFASSLLKIAWEIQDYTRINKDLEFHL